MNELKYFKRSKVVNEPPISSAVMQIKVDRIRPNRAQPRAEFDNNSIIRLADSIRRYGILQPLTVRKCDDDDIFDYELIAGERRLRAARLLGYFTVPCIVIEADERMSAEMAIIENLLREDLNMFEQAYGFKQLIENYSMTQEEVARKMSLSQSAVANKLRLLKLSYEEQKLIIESGLTERHARALLKIDSQEQRIEIIRHISSMKLNVLSTEQYIDNILKRATEEQIADPAQSLEDRYPNPDKAMNDMIATFQKKVDSLKKCGKDASISVVNNLRAIDVHIRINKN